MPLRKLANASAHRILSKLIDLGLVPSETVTAVERSEAHGVQVTVHITKYDGPPQLHLTMEGYQRLGIEPPAPARNPAPSLPDPSKLPPRKKNILELLKGQPPRKGEWIAHKLKRAYEGGIRTDLAELVAAGFLEKGDDGRGYFLAKLP